MSKKLFKTLLLLSVILMFIFVEQSHSQEEGKVIIISPKVGKVIDLEERNRRIDAVYPMSGEAGETDFWGPGILYGYLAGSITGSILAAAYTQRAKHMRLWEQSSFWRIK